MRFAYVASHDLQEPLRTISSFLTLFMRRYGSGLSEDAAETIGFAVDASKRMQGLVADLLEYSRVGSEALRFEPVSLRQVADEVVRMCREQIRETGASVQLGELPTIPGDRIKLAQVLQNLIGIALKYRNNALPVIRIFSELRGREHVIAVQDNGIGFDSSYSEKIFVMFHRLHGFGEYSGTGMGLAICKRIVDAHGGRIWAESTPGKGSTFYFTLPMEQPAKASAVAV